MLSLRILKPLLTLLLLCSFTFLLAQNNPPEPDDEFEAYLLVGGFVFLCVAGGLFTAGFLLLMGITGLAVLLTALGILSSSFLVALHKRSLMAGFKTFLYLLLPLSGAITGATFFWGIAVLFHLHLGFEANVTVGALSGIVGGLLLAFVIILIFKKLSKKLALSL